MKCNARLNLLMVLLLNMPAFACTDVRISALDGSIIIARTMEFAVDLKSNLRTQPREHAFKPTLPNGKLGLAWTSKYGYLYLDGLNVDMASEGMNEQGLAFEALYLPNFAQYQEPVAGQEAKTLSYFHIGDWALSQFSTVAEIVAELPNIILIAEPLKETGNQVLPLHFSFHDAGGNSIVVEYIGGKLHIHDNKIGVMTNAPSFDWHVTNLNNYVNLRPTNPKPIKTKDMTFIATGQGSGMLGLPGDISPPSRFVKMAVFKVVVLPPKDAQAAVNLAQHMVNNVDIPLGLAREPADANNYSNEYTQWTVFKDLRNKVFYYHTYANLNLRKIDMQKIDFKPKARALKMPIEGAEDAVLDVTHKFTKT